MIRWKYVLPRLTLVAAVLLFATFGLDPLLRWSVVRLGEQVVGAKVDLRDARVSLGQTKLKLSGLQVANPKSPLENLFQVDSLVLDFDSQAIMRRQFVVERASVHGLEIEAARESSGELPIVIKKVEPSTTDGLNLPEFGDQLLRNIGDVAEAKLRKDLKSIALAEQLQDRWTTKYKLMKERVDAIEGRVRGLRDLYRNLDRDDPLKIAEAIQQANQQALSLRNEMQSLRDEIENVQVEAGRDVVAIEDAKRHDLDYLKNSIRLDEFRSGQIAEYLLEEEMRQRLETVMAWVGRCRAVVNATSQPDPPRGKGVDILFSQRHERPSFLIRHLAIDGFAQIDSRRVPFVAEAHAVTSHPKLVGQPTQVRIATTGEIAAVVDAVFDYTGERPRQKYVVDIPHLATPARTWGDADNFALSVSKSHARVWCELETSQGQVRGRVIFVQDDVQLRPHSAELGERMETRLGVAMSRINKLHAVIDLNGPLRRPDWRLQSNLGPQVADALNVAMNSELEYRKQQLADKLDTTVRREIGKLDTLVETKKQELLGKLDLNSDQINQLKNLVAEMANLSSLRLPGGMSLDRFFRR